MTRRRFISPGAQRSRAISKRFNVPVEARPRRARARCAFWKPERAEQQQTSARPQTEMPLPKIKHIAVRFALIMALAAVVPLIFYGIVSILSLQRGTRTSIIAGNENVATRAAEEIRRYVTTNAEILKSLAADLQDTGLSVAQQDRILKNYILQFREFHEVTLFDEAGCANRHEPRRRLAAADPEGRAIHRERREDDRHSHRRRPAAHGRLRDSSHAAQSARRLARRRNRASRRCGGWSTASASANMATRWSSRRTASSSRTATPTRKHSSPRQRNMRGNPLVSTARDDAPVAQRVRRRRRPARTRRGRAHRAARMDRDRRAADERGVRDRNAAPETARRRDSRSSLRDGGARLRVRPFVHRSDLHAASAARSDLADGNLATRVTITTGDEFADLGDSFNTMANRLVELQENVKRQERSAMFGRVAAGLVHDLLHPIQNVGNNTRLLLRGDLDQESREDCGRIIDREMTTIKRFLDDLHNIVKPKPIERFAMDVNGTVAEVVDAMRPEGDRSGVLVEARLCRRAAHDRGRPVRARPRVPQPDHERDPGDSRRWPRVDHDRARRRIRRRYASATRDRASRRIGSPRSSTNSSRRSAADSASASRSPSASSSSSTARSWWRARSGKAPRSRFGFPSRGDLAARAAAS